MLILLPMHATHCVQARGYTSLLHRSHDRTAIRPVQLYAGPGETLRTFVDSTLSVRNSTTAGAGDGHSEMTIAIMTVARARDDQLLIRILSVASQLGSKS
eukprot:SAG31_NODE_7501_length_1670_cov_1.703374_3_plen_99_part_01